LFVAQEVTQLDLFATILPQLPPYQVRESERARHVSIKISLQGAIEVVVPCRFDLNQLPSILEKRRDWIVRTRARLLTEHEEIKANALGNVQMNGQRLLPEWLELRSQAETWQIAYQNDPHTNICLPTPGKTLKIQAQIDSLPTCHQLLKQWLTHKAHRDLIPWLRQLSFDIGLPFKQASIRGQKTRWASCSSRKDISLNYKLLFLPPPLVEYIFVHELCHTLEMNHSSKFWHLVGQKQPGYEQWRNDLKTGWKYMPLWLD
jgi:predicted metal-dependent hydrolase